MIVNTNPHPKLKDSIISLASVATSPQIQLYFPLSSNMTLSMISWCVAKSTEKWTWSSGLISLPSFNHFTGLSGLDSSHSKMTLSSSLAVKSVRGFLNSAGSSIKYNIKHWLHRKDIKMYVCLIYTGCFIYRVWVNHVSLYMTSEYFKPSKISL